MDINKKITYIEKILQNQSISKAASDLFVSQPYISKFIKNLENELGIELFQKTKTKINLSFAGQIYYNYLKETYKTEQKFLKDLEIVKNNKKGRIKLGINPALSTAFLYKFLPNFKKSNPHILVELVEVTQDVSEKMLENNELDLVLGMYPACHKNLAYSLIFSEKMFLYVSKNNQLYDKQMKNSKIFSKDAYSLLNNEPFITTSLEYGMGKSLENFFKSYNLELNTSIITSTVPTAVNLAKSGMGLTLIPETIIKNYTTDDANLYHFNIKDISAEYIIMFKKNNSLDPIKTSFINFTLEALAK